MVGPTVEYCVCSRVVCFKNTVGALEKCRVAKQSRFTTLSPYYFFVKHDDATREKLCATLAKESQKSDRSRGETDLQLLYRGKSVGLRMRNICMSGRDRSVSLKIAGLSVPHKSSPRGHYYFIRNLSALMHYDIPSPI